MESRLPKPKFNSTSTVSNSFTTMNNHVIKKRDDLPHSTATATTVNLNRAKSTINIHKAGNENPSQTGLENVTDRLKKAKSTLNINTKSTNENKPPPVQKLVRSKTVSSITTASRAIKRPGAATVHGDNKKACTKLNGKPISTNRTGNPSGNTTDKSVQSTINKKGTVSTAVKPSKWDLKGRLAYTMEELSSIRQQFKDSTTKCSELQEQVNELSTNINLYKTMAEEFEASNKLIASEMEKLKEEMSNIREEMSKVQEERNDLKKRLKDSEDSYTNASKTLQEYESKCLVQERALLNHKTEVEKLKTNLESQTKNNEELQSLAYKMDKDRRILHNTIQELKGNIRVFCRVRPRTPSEAIKPLCAINFIDENTIEVGRSDGSDAVSCSGKLRGSRQEFTFDKVFLPTAKQAEVFEELALLVQSALEGYNVCVFAYGQTGSGKTFTMEGMPDDEMEGMIPRTVRHIFQEMKQFQLMGWEYEIEASFLEIYNEHIVDLLDAQPKNHEIRMVNSKGQDLYVSNLRVEQIHSSEELHKCLLTAQRNRAVAATSSNQRSSRSHSVTRIRLLGTHRSKQEVSIGNLNLVDLAGSERLKGEELVRMTETKNINKSLANLGNVILALLKKQEHIPYRNSKLTHLLQPSLGGNSKTLMLLNISPLDECYNETLNSLRFGSNVNSCKTGNVKRARTVLQND